MKSRSYAKFLQRGALSSSFGILSIGFGILAWTVNFTSQEFSKRNNLDSLSSIQSRGSIILSQVGEDGGPRDVSGDLQTIRVNSGGDSNLCVVYLNSGVIEGSTDASCNGSVSAEMQSAALRAWTHTVISFDRNAPQLYSLNSVSGPEVSSTSKSINTMSLEPSCFRIGRGFGCQNPGGGAVSVESSFTFTEAQTG